MKKNYCPYVHKGLRIAFKQSNQVLLSSTKPCCHIVTENFPDTLEPFAVENLLSTQNMQYFQNYFDNNNDLPPACVSCIKLEAVNETSHRLRAIKNEEDLFDIYKLDIVLGNYCNLACPFCSSHASSLINSLSHKHKNEHLPEMWKPRNSNNDPTNSSIEKSINDILKKYKCQSIKIIGGEPFLAEHWNIFEQLLNQDVLKDSILEITTNGTIINQKILNSLSKTKKTILRISVDSIDLNYNFIRWPYTFDKIFKNMKFLAENKNDNIHVRLSALINVINFEYLPDLENYLEVYKNPQEDFLISYETLVKPEGQSMDWRYLSQEIVDDVCSKLKNKNLVDLIKNESLFVNKENTTNTLKFLLKQRNMKAEDVFKPATQRHFNL